MVLLDEMQGADEHKYHISLWNPNGALMIQGWNIKYMQNTHSIGNFLAV